MISESGYINCRKDKIVLTVIGCIAYFCSYMTRVNYKTILLAIEEYEGLDKDTVSIALTGLLLTYGIGQLISGWLGDRVNPKYLMSGGLVLASAMNILLPLFAGNITAMTVIWSINGLGQAMMWPPIVKTLTNFLAPKDYIKATVRVSWGASFATILLYLVCPFIISFSGGYKAVFYICAAVGSAGAVLLFIILTKFEKKYPDAGKILPDDAAEQEKTATAEKTDKKRAGIRMPKSIYGFFGILMIVIILLGALRDGVDAWMTSYVKDTFGITTENSIMTGVILPIFTIISYQAATSVYNKVFRNEMTSAGAFFALSAVSAGTLLLIRIFVTGISGFSFIAVISILLLACIVGCMHGISLLVTCFIPDHFRKYGNISWISGLTNFATYIGSAASTYGFALITKKLNWNSTILFWILLSSLGVAVCIWGFFPWRKILKRLKG